MSDKQTSIGVSDKLQIARIVIKLEIKRKGGKISHFDSADITKVAKAFLETREGQAMLKQIEKAMLKRV